MTTSRLKEYKDNDFNEIIRKAEAVIADSERLEEGAVGNFLSKAGQKVGNAISNGVQKVAAWGGNVAAKAQAAAQQGYQQGQQEVQQQAQPQQQVQAPQQQQQAQLQAPQQQNQQQIKQQAPAENTVKPEEVKKIEQSVQEQDKKIDNLEKKVDELAKKKESLNRTNRFREADPPAAAPQTTYQKANGQTQGQNMRAMQNAANLKNNQKDFNQFAAHNIKNLRGDINAASNLIADNAEGISQNKAGIAQNTQAIQQQGQNIQQQGKTIQQQGTQIQANADNLKTTANKVVGVSQQLGKTTALAKQTATKVEEIVNSQASTEEKVAQLDTTAKETQATISQIQQAMRTGQTDQVAAQKQIQELQAQLKQIQDLQKNTDQLNGKGNGLSPREAKVAQATLTQQLSSPAVAQKINSMLPQIGLRGTSFRLLGVEQAQSPSEDALRFKVKFQLVKGKKMVASQDPALIQARVFLLSLTEAAVQNQAALLTNIIAQVLQSVAANGITYVTDIKPIKGEGELAAEEQAAAAQNGETPVEDAPVEEAPAADQAQPEAKPAEEKKEEKPAEEAKEESKEEVKNESLLDLSARLSEAGNAAVYETYIDLYPSGRASATTGFSRAPSNLETIYANMSDKEKKKFNKALAKNLARGNGPSTGNKNNWWFNNTYLGASGWK